MADESTFTLTLDPIPEESAPAASAVAALAQEAEEEVKAAEAEKEEEKAPGVSLDGMSPAEQQAIRAFSEKIDILNAEQIMNYGINAQKNISEFSDAALSTVRTKDLGEVGGMLSDLVVELKGLSFDAEEKKGFLGLFKKSAQKMETLKTQYAKAEGNVDKITTELSNHRITLLKDIALMDKMYDKNQEYMKELTMYILAGKLRIETLRNVDLPALIAKANETGNPEDAQAANDFANMIGRFEKKIYDLELTRNISLQMAPQIRMIQNNDTLMAERISTSIVNTIPLWKNQMVLALAMHNSEQAMKAQREVTDVTNSILMKNAQTLHQGSVAIAKEAERGVVDLETLQKTNQDLIATLEEVRAIQDEGRAKRTAAEVELGRIETELRSKLLSMKG